MYDKNRPNHVLTVVACKLLGQGLEARRAVD